MSLEKFTQSVIQSVFQGRPVRNSADADWDGPSPAQAPALQLQPQNMAKPSRPLSRAAQAAHDWEAQSPEARIAKADAAAAEKQNQNKGQEDAKRPTSDSIKLISRKVDFQTASELVREISAKISRWHAAKAQEVRCSPANSLAMFRAQTEELRKQAAEDPEALAKMENTWSRQDFMEDAEQRRKAFHSVCADLANEIHMLARPEYLRWAALVNELAARIEADDKALAKELGLLPFTPSSTVQALRAFAQRVAARAETFSPGANPESLVDFLIE